MAQATIGGVTYEIAPMNFRRLRRAAPFIDAARAKLESGTPSITASMESASDVLQVVAIALDDPAVTAEALEDAASVPEVLALNHAFVEILRDAGMISPGEKTPAEAPAPRKVSRSK